MPDPAPQAAGRGKRRVLFVSHLCLLDDASGVAVSNLALMQTLARQGFAVEALCGTMFDLEQEVDPVAHLAERGWSPEPEEGTVSRSGANLPPHLRLTCRGIPLTLHRCPSTTHHTPDDSERQGFLRLCDALAARARPDVLVAFGDDPLIRDLLAGARKQGIVTVFTPHDTTYRHPVTFAHVDAVLVPTLFAADYYREALGLECTTLPHPIDLDRVRVESPEPRFVTFVNPTADRGVYVFARIADEMGRRRPDIPLLVVESGGTEATLAACGLDLGVHGNVHVMPPTADPRQYWSVTRIGVLPLLGWEVQPLAAAEALVNGIPVVASDRGGLPETLGQSGVILTLPDRLTPATRLLPTAAEVTPWVEAILRLWDDAAAYDERRRLALAESERWAPVTLDSRYARFFDERRPGTRPAARRPPGRAKAVVLVPHLNGIDWECEQGLRKLEEAGVRVIRRGGSSAIDVARNILISEALHNGAETMLFIDADVGFNPLDALRLLARPEPVVAGVYAKKGQRAMASAFAPGLDEIVFGARARGLYPLRYAATGFLRIRAAVLRRMIEQLRLPLCNTLWGKGIWPFFLPLIVRHEVRGLHYLGEDWAFSYRLGKIGVTPLADTSIRLWHYGRYGFGWEDAGRDTERYHTYTYRSGKK